MLAKIEWNKIGELVWVAPLAAFAVAVCFSLVIFGLSRAGEARRGGASGSAAAFTGLTAVAGAAFAAIVVLGVIVIAKK